MSNVYVYDISASNPYSTEDLGLITSSVDAGEDYQQISSATLSQENYFSITIDEDILAFGSIGSISGSAEVSKSNVFTGRGTIICAQTIDENVTFTWVGSGTLFEIGNGLERTIRPYVSSGTLRVVTGSFVSGTDFSDTNISFDSTDVGFDNIPQTYDTYDALVSFSANPSEDNVLYQFNSSSDYREIQVYGVDYVPTGTISLYGELVYPNIDYTPSPDGSGVIAISGVGNEAYVRNTYQGSGSLFEFGTKLESRRFVYDETSITPGILDYGFTYGELNAIEDLGYVSESNGPVVDYGLLQEVVVDPIYPFGSVSFSGISENREIQVYGVDYVPTGTISIYGELVHPNIDYTPSPDGSGIIAISGVGNESFVSQVDESTQIFNIIGSAATRELDVYGYYGDDRDPGTSGTLLVSGDYSQLQSTKSEVGFGTISLYGELVHPNIDYTPSITGFGTITILASSLTASEKEIDSYVGLGTVSISGSALEALSANTPENTQLFSFSGSALESLSAQTPENTQLFSFSGELIHPNIDYTPHYGIEKNIGIGTTGINLFGTYTNLKSINSYLTSGTLFGFGTKLESRTYVYDETSIVDDSLDYQFISSTIDEPSIDYGSIGEGADPQLIDYESITSGIYGYAIPYGSIVVSSSLDESYSYSNYIGSGRLTLSGSYSELQSIKSEVGFGTISLYGQLVHPNIDYTPHYGIDKNIGIGTTGIQFSGSALEALSAQTPENTQLFTFSGSALEFLSANTPENTQLFSFSGSALESDIDSYVGLGTVSISGSALESDIDSYVGLGTVSISGSALESLSAQTPENTQLFTFSGSALEALSANTPENTQLFNFSGELVHPNIDYTPHYGIEKNIGVGTTGIKLSVSSRNYSNRYPGPGGGLPDNAGIGTFRFDQTNNTAKYGVLTPYAGGGLFTFLGTGFESFSIVGFNGSGRIQVSSIGRYREIAVYTGVGSGQIQLSTQTRETIEKNVNSYSTSGNISISGSSSDIKEIKSYRGLGTVSISGSALEALSAQTPENTQLFTFSGSALEALSANTPENTQLFSFSGNSIEKVSENYQDAGGLVSISGLSVQTTSKNNVGSGKIKFTTNTVDQDYITCDYDQLTCDYEYSAKVSFVANPVESTQIFVISGIASTKNTKLLTYSAAGSIGISPTSTSKKTKSFVGIGTINISSAIENKNIRSYGGSGSISVISGTSKSLVVNSPDNTVLSTLSGSASTRFFRVKSYSGIGTGYFSGTSITNKFSRISSDGVGSITLYGQLVYPNIKFIPTPKGNGVIEISGASFNKFGYKYYQTSGSLFAISTGKESYAKSGYIGIGTISIAATSSIAINNPFQISRVYAIII